MLRSARGDSLVHLSEPVLDFEVEVPRTVVTLGIAYARRSFCKDAHPLIDGGDGVDMELLLPDGFKHLIGDYQVAYILDRDDDTLLAAEACCEAGPIETFYLLVYPAHWLDHPHLVH